MKGPHRKTCVKHQLTTTYVFLALLYTEAMYRKYRQCVYWSKLYVISALYISKHQVKRQPKMLPRWHMKLPASLCRTEYLLNWGPSEATLNIVIYRSFLRFITYQRWCQSRNKLCMAYLWLKITDVFSSLFGVHITFYFVHWIFSLGMYIDKWESTWRGKNNTLNVKRKIQFYLIMPHIFSDEMYNMNDFQLAFTLGSLNDHPWLEL